MRSSKHKIATFAILLGWPCPCCIWQNSFTTILDRPYQTETAIEYDLSDSLLCEGYLAFDQSGGAGRGLLGYLVENGERVAQNGQVAEQYTDESQGRARQRLTELDAQIELLKNPRTRRAAMWTCCSPSARALLRSLDQLDSQNYQGVTRQANAYLLAVNRLQITTGAIRDFSAARSLLERGTPGRAGQQAARPPVTAPAGGYFVAAAAGEWLEYDADQLDAMGAAEIADALESGAGVRAMSGAGKPLVGSYKWRFYGVCALQESKKFENVGKGEPEFPR